MKIWVLAGVLAAAGVGIVVFGSADARRWLRPVAIGLGLLPPRHETASYRARVEAFARENRRLVAPCAVLLGDSLSEGFPDANAERLGIANRGISGDRVEDLERRLEASVLTAPCQTVLLLGGTNDVVLDGADPASVSAALLAIAERLQADGRRVFLVSLPPVEGDHAAARPSVRALNQQLAAAAPARGLRWLDLHAVLTNAAAGPPSPLAADRLHLSPEGYGRFAALLERAFLPRELVVPPGTDRAHSSPTSSDAPAN